MTTTWSAPRGGSPSPVRDAVVATAGAVLAALAALALAPLGRTVLYVGGVAVVLGTVCFSLRAELAPPFRDAARRARAVRDARRSHSRVARAAVMVASTAAVAVGAFLLAGLGLIAVGGLAALAVLAATTWLCWPLVHDLAMGGPPALEALASPARPRWSNGSALRRSVGMICVVGGVGTASFMLAQLGLKGVLSAVGLIIVVALMVLLRNRSEFFTFLAVTSLTFVLHKSFSTQDLQQSGGAISVYVTTFDVFLVILYGLWIHEGTFVTDVQSALRRPIMLVPLVGMFLLLPSVLIAPSAEHSGAELFRMCWMYLLFFYAAVRVRTRRHVWSVLAGLAVFAGIEFVIVVLQWRTGGVLGLSFLGVPTTLTQRTTDSSDIGRPFGTIIHPVFMGATMGSLGMVALSLAITLRRSLTKIVAGVLVALCAIPLYLSHDRASTVAALIAAAYVVGVGLARGQLQWSTVRRFALAAVVGVVVFWPALSAKFTENFGTGHFWEEIRSRLQLNGIALHMMSDHPILGVGLNNFETVLPKYEPHLVIFFGNPVHNLYLLYFSETGIVGFVGFALVAVSMFRATVRAARSRDRLLGGFAVGVVGMMIFLGLEELLGFSLRQDIPLAMFWLLVGVCLACMTIERHDPPADEEPALRRGPAIRPRPTQAVPRHRQPSAPSRTETLRPHGVVGGVVNELRAVLQGPASVVRGAAAAVVRVAGRDVAILRVGGSRRPRLVAGVFAALLFGAGLSLAASSQASRNVPSRVVFDATVRGTEQSGIYTADVGGTDVTHLTPSDGRAYQWPRWAFHNTKIVYTRTTFRPAHRRFTYGIWLMNANGSDKQLIDNFDFPVVQPLIDARGHWMYFTAATPWFKYDAVFRMNLRTLQSTNITGVTRPLGAIDADPVLTSDQRRIVLISGSSTQATVDIMDTTGSHRSTLVSNGHFNTDPDISPNGSHLVTSTYLGKGKPHKRGTRHTAKTEHFKLLDVDLGTGNERALTRGDDCASRQTGHPCTPAHMSAYVPRYFDGGRSIAYDGALDRKETCICAIDADGSDPRVLLSSTALAIEWFDLPQTRGTSTGADRIGSDVPKSKILITAKPVGRGRDRLWVMSPDLMHRTRIRLPGHLSPIQARWSHNRSLIAFTASVPIPKRPRPPNPAAPAGRTRRIHVTLADLSPAAVSSARASAPPRRTARRQVFVRFPDGTVRQITNPWIEDWHDGLAPGDARANTDPTFTRNGRSVIVTNTSTLDGESFLLKINLRTGRVTNLTNETSGAVPVYDSAPTTSPDGRRVAFITRVGNYSDVFAMNTSNGRDIREITQTDAPDAEPTWVTSGRGVLSLTTSRGVSVIARTGLDHRERFVTSRELPRVADPVANPSGGQVLFTALCVDGISVFRAPLSGRGAVVLVQPDSTLQVLDLDWR